MALYITIIRLIHVMVVSVVLNYKSLIMKSPKSHIRYNTKSSKVIAWSRGNHSPRVFEEIDLRKEIT